MWYGFFKHALVRPVMKWGFKGRIEGEQNIPSAGGAILASNHLSAIDTLATPSLMRRPLTFPAKAELFKGNRGPASKVVAWFLKAVGQVPLDRSGGRASASGLDPVIEVLRDGGLVGIYPEGTRSPDGRLYKGKTGVARLALSARVPVVPVGVVDSQLGPKKLGIPWPAKPPVVRVGEPLDFSPWYGLEGDRAVLRWVTDEVMRAIQQLTGQAYVDAYGSTVKYGEDGSAKAEARVRPSPGTDDPPPPTAADRVS